MSGLQCHKRLFLECYRRELIPTPSPDLQLRFDYGHEFGVFAHGLRPGGVLIKEGHRDHKQAVASTRDALLDPAVPSIYEAAFTFDDVKVRADIMCRAGDDAAAWDMIEVKSATHVKPEYVHDMAVQLRVVEGCGVKVRNCLVAHVNKDYRYPGGDHVAADLISLSDVTAEARSLGQEVASNLAAMRRPLWLLDEPAVEPADMCRHPYDCPFITYCSPARHAYPVSDFPLKRKSLMSALAGDGIESVSGVPLDYEHLNELERRVVRAVLTSEVYIDPEAGRAIGALGRPLYFLDFETVAPPIPYVPGTGPYQVVPFQFSIHVLDQSGELRHHEYLHDDNDDPRGPLAKSLISALGDAGPIVMYSDYERTVIRDLAAGLPEIAAELHAILARLTDMLPIFKKYVYHKDFHGSFSIKSVLPALIPHLTYKNLEISDGSSASYRFLKLISGTASPDERAGIRRALLEYCGQDSLAMVELYQWLKQSLASGGTKVMQDRVPGADLG